MGVNEHYILYEIYDVYILKVIQCAILQKYNGSISNTKYHSFTWKEIYLTARKATASSALLYFI